MRSAGARGKLAGMLYLHETIEIRGHGSEPYLRAVLERARHSEAQGISRLLGAWRVIGSTHRWPRVVNLWEMDGWDHWARTLARQFVPEFKDPQLAPWWKEMTHYRRGGFDRILEPLPVASSCTALAEAGKRAWVAEQTIYRGPAGSERTVLEEVVGTQVAQREAAGIWLLGSYRAPFQPGEALVLWAATDFRTLCQWWEDWSSEQQRTAWEARLCQWRVRSETLWLTPAAGTLLDPLRG